MTLCPIGLVAKRYGVSPSTIRRWEKAGLIKAAVRTFGGHRRFELESGPRASGVGRRHVGYARVSSHDQKGDLIRQVERLRESGCEEVITDIGSGLNCRKPGLRSLIGLILKKKIHTLTVVHEDRLLRFATELIRLLCLRTGTSVRVLENRPSRSFEEELARDVVTLMTVFCARLYGRRSHQSKKRKASRDSGPMDNIGASVHALRNHDGTGRKIHGPSPDRGGPDPGTRTLCQPARLQGGVPMP
ncbi:MAG: IS607 family transposase [Sutterellaceae bacterium]|nr:IS607 family transposase [Sutterellaceae bacterium]